MPSWYKKGADGIKMGQQIAAEDKKRRDNRIPFKFRMDAGDTKKGTFLDNPNFFFSMHSVKNSRGVWDDYTCLHDTETCPLCEDGNRPSYVLAATIIDHAGYVDKDGKRFKFVKQLAIFKQVARTRILKRRDSAPGKTLKYCCLEFSRDGDRECATGEEITFRTKVTGAQFKKMMPKSVVDKGKDEMKKWLTPFDLMTIFKPRSADELRKIVGGKAPVGSEPTDDIFNEDSTTPSVEDDLFGESEKNSEFEETPTEDKKESDIDDLI